MAAVVGRHPVGLKQSFRGVCFVAPEIERIGGYELATLAFARSLRQRGVSVLVVTVTRGGVNPAADADVIRINVRGQHTLLSVFPKLVAVLARERSRYSVIHCSTFDHISGLAVLAGRILGRRTLVRVATEKDVREFSDGRELKTRLFFHILCTAARVIAPSVAIRDELWRSGFPSKRIVYLPNCVDVDAFRPATPSEKAEAKNAIGIPRETPVIGTVARLVDIKGIDILLRAFSKIHRRHDACLVLVGDGPLLNDLRTLANELRIDGSVSWLGLQKDTDKLLRAIDVFAFPSRSEGSPNAVLEAMATALPIVATSVGGVIDLLGSAGLLVPTNDSDALAAELHRLLCDQYLRADLGRRARARAVESFSLKDNVSRLVDLYVGLDGS